MKKKLCIIPSWKVHISERNCLSDMETYGCLYRDRKHERKGKQGESSEMKKLFCNGGSRWPWQMDDDRFLQKQVAQFAENDPMFKSICVCVCVCVCLELYSVNKTASAVTNCWARSHSERETVNTRHSTAAEGMILSHTHTKEHTRTHTP